MDERSLRSTRGIMAAGLLAAAAACGPHVGVSGGLGIIDYGGGDGPALTPIAGARLGIPDRGGSGALVADLQPVPVPASGSYDVSTLFLLPSLVGATGPIHVRGGVGYSLNLYSNDHSSAAGQGKDVAGGLCAGFALSLRLSRHGPGNWDLEAFTTFNGEPSRQEGARFIGVQLMKYVR